MLAWLVINIGEKMMILNKINVWSYQARMIAKNMFYMSIYLLLFMMNVLYMLTYLF